MSASSLYSFSLTVSMVLKIFWMALTAASTGPEPTSVASWSWPLTRSLTVALGRRFIPVTTSSPSSSTMSFVSALPPPIIWTASW